MTKTGRGHRARATEQDTSCPIPECLPSTTRRCRTDGSSGTTPLARHLPAQGLSGGQRHDLGAGKGQALGNGPVLALQGNGAGIGRPSVEAGAVQACKGIQLTLRSESVGSEQD